MDGDALGGGVGEWVGLLWLLSRSGLLGFLRN